MDVLPRTKMEKQTRTQKESSYFFQKYYSNIVNETLTILKKDFRRFSLNCKIVNGSNYFDKIHTFVLYLISLLLT